MAAPYLVDFNAIGAAYPGLSPFSNAVRIIVGLDVIPLSWLASLGAALVLVITFDRAFRTKSSGARQAPSLRAYVQDLSVILVQVALFGLLARLHPPTSWQELAPGLGAGLRELAGLHDRPAPEGHVVAAFLLVVFLVGNLSTYLVHRLLHAVPCLWELHKFHHSAESLGVFSGFREHPLAVLLNGSMVVLGTTAVAIPFLVCYPGLASSPDLFAGGLLGFVAFKGLFLLTHFHRPISYGIFDAVIVSPAIHAIHHSRDPRHFNRNFGANITLWDKLFGTFHRPTDEELARLAYGLDPAEGGTAGRFLPLRYLYLSTTWRALKAVGPAAAAKAPSA